MRAREEKVGARALRWAPYLHLNQPHNKVPTSITISLVLYTVYIPMALKFNNRCIMLEISRVSYARGPAHPNTTRPSFLFPF